MKCASFGCSLVWYAVFECVLVLFVVAKLLHIVVRDCPYRCCGELAQLFGVQVVHTVRVVLDTVLALFVVVLLDQILSDVVLVGRLGMIHELVFVQLLVSFPIYDQKRRYRLMG